MYAKEILRTAGLRVTQTRLDMISIFKSHDYALGHGVIEDILPGVDRITVYRTLKTFEECGIIHKIPDSSGATKYALCEALCLNHDHHHDHHVHFHCDVCDHTFCVDEVAIPEVSLPEKYKVKEKNLIITGTCENCTEE